MTKHACIELVRTYMNATMQYTQGLIFTGEEVVIQAPIIFLSTQ